MAVKKDKKAKVVVAPEIVKEGVRAKADKGNISCADIVKARRKGVEDKNAKITKG